MPTVLNVRLEARVATNPQNPISQFFENEDDDDFIREECGVVGIYGDPEVARLCYLALHALQHRGQEGVKIVTATYGRLQSITDVGLVADVFDESKLNQLPRSLAIDHVRYSTADSSMLKNVESFVAGYMFGSVGVSHNGNLENYQTLRDLLEESGSIFNTSSDREVVLHLISISKARPFMQADMSIFDVKLQNKCQRKNREQSRQESVTVHQN